MSLSETTVVPDALYNRYRPRKLSELVGQEHVAVPLRRAFDKGRIHHAYLLTGPRGCGKTSTARILAAGLVCESGPTADPCNECDQCTAVIKGNHIDVVEIDAASNRSIDEMRALREKSHFAPAIARYKVLVIDEAHQILKEAASVLLKLIEEPPPHVRFIFATTDPDKMLQTIRSRTYHYSFRLVPAPVAAAHLAEVVAKEGCTLEEGVLPLILRAGGGSMRDSLALLGQLLDGSDNGTVRLDEAAALIGATADTVLDEVLEAFARRDTAATLSVIGAALDTGADPMQLAADLLDRLRDLLLLVSTGVLPPLAEVASTDRQAAWRTVADRLGVRGLTSACEVLQHAVANTYSGQPRITLEVAAARVLLSLADTVDVHGALTALSQQVASLNRNAATGTGSGNGGLPPVYATTPTTAPAASADTSPNVDIAGAPASSKSYPPSDGAQAQSAPSAAPTAAPAADTVGNPEDWSRILDAIAQRRRATWSLLSSNAKVGHLDAGRILLMMPTVGLADATIRGHLDIIAAAAADVLGGHWDVTVQVVQG